MRFCDDYNHVNIAFDSKECPLCEALEQIKELEKGMIELADELNSARDANKNL